MTQKNFFSLQRSLGLLCFFSLIFFSVAAFQLATKRYIDTSDGYAFLFQSRRLLDPQFAWIRPLLIRPRALVVILSSLDAMYNLVLNRFPELVDYHVFMVGVTVGFILVWVSLLSRLLGRSVGYGVGILLCVHSTLMENASLCLSDIMAGLFQGMFLHLLLSHLQNGQSDHSSLKKLKLPIAMGICGAFLGVSKHQVFLLFPFTLGVFGAAYLFLPWFKQKPWGKLTANLGWLSASLFCFLIGLDLINRVFTAPDQGVGSHLIYFVQILLYVRNLDPAYVINGDPLLYVKDFMQSYGVMVPLLLVGWVIARFSTQSSTGEGQSSDAAKRMVTLLFFIGSAVFALQNQKFANKETRYMMPFLPVLLTPIVSGALKAWHSLKGWKRTTWAAICLIALVHPTSEAISRDREGQQIAKHWVDNPNPHMRLWFSLMSPAVDGRSCNSLYACETYHSGMNFGWGYFFYHMGYKPRVADCSKFGEDTASIRKGFQATTPMGSCYLMSLNDATSTSGVTIVTERYAGGKLTEAERAALKNKLSDTESLECELGAQGQSTCFISRRFKNL